MPIRAALFDVGRVIVGFDTSRISHRLSKFSPFAVYHINDAIFRVYKNGERNELLKNFEEGGITAVDFYQQVRVLIQASAELTFERFLDIWPDIFYENPGINDLLVELRKKGIVCVAISTTDEITRSWLVNNIYAIRDHFANPKSNVLSFRVGASKPNEKVWQAALDRVQCSPQEIVYIDDIKDLNKLINRVRLTDKYTDSINLEIRYRHPERNLNKNEVEDIRQQIEDLIATKNNLKSGRKHKKPVD